MSNTNQPKKPAFVAKSRQLVGEAFRYERIGAGFENEDGSVYVQLYGTQVVSSFMLYPLADAPSAGAED